MTDRIRTRFLIIGSGVAGLHTAWRASQTDDVLVVSEAYAEEWGNVKNTVVHAALTEGREFAQA